MSLRVRMGLAAGVAVALAVIAVALTAYAGTRSELKGQVDQSLKSLTGSVLTRARIGVGGRPADGRSAPPVGRSPAGSATGPGSFSTKDPDDKDEGLGFDDRLGPPF